MAGRLRLAVVGGWHVHAADYGRQALGHPDTELITVWDDDEVRGRDLAAQLDVPYTPDLPTLLNRDDLDAVTVTTATTAHRDVILSAAQAGKHVFTEKVLAPTVAECEEILAACETAGVVVMVSMPRLYAGYTRAIVERLERGSLGRLTYGRVRLAHDGASRGWLPERFFDPSTAVGGALTDLGCHPTYLVQRFLGVAPDTVTATYRSVTGRRLEDSATVTVGYATGSIGVIEASFVSPPSFSIELHGTEGTLSYRDADDQLVGSGAAFGTDAGRTVPLLAADSAPFDQWIRHLGAGTRPADNLARAVELTRLVCAANTAAASGRTTGLGKDDLS